MKSLLNYHLLLFIGLPLVLSTTSLIVDCSYSSQSGNIYPSLNQAIAALVNSYSYLIDMSNFVTIKESCLSVPQNLTYSWVLGTGVETFVLEYENTPSIVNQASTCSQLPTLEITSDVCLDFQNIQTVLISGMNIQYYEASSVGLLVGITNLVFTNFCFNNSEPNYASWGLSGGSLPSQYASYIEIIYVGTILMTNGVYSWDGLKEISIGTTSQVMIDEMTYLPLSSMQPTVNPPLQVLNMYGYFDTVVTITDVQIVCPPVAILMPMFFDFLYINGVSISGLSILNCDFNQAGSRSQQLMTVNIANYFLMDDITINNYTYGQYNYQYTGVFNSIPTLSISDLNMVNLHTAFAANTDTQLFQISNSLDYPMQMYFTNWVFTESIINGYNQIVCVTMNAAVYSDIQVQNISVVNSSFLWENLFFWFHFQSPTTNTLTLSYNSIIVNNITFNGVYMNTTCLFLLQYDNTNGIKAVELFHTLYSNVTLTNNYFAYASVFQCEGCLASVSNLVASNNTLKDASSFYASTVIVSTFFLMNSQISDIILTEQSGFALSNVTGIRDYQLEATYDDGGTAIFAETRPFIVYNCTFTNISADTASVLILSTNPMVIVQNNTFKNVTINSSNLLELGGYSYFFTSHSDYLEAWDYYFYSPSPSIVGAVIFLAAESATFRDSPALYQVYTDSRAKIASCEPQNAVFFINVQDNVIDILQSNQNSEIISLGSFAIDNSTVSIINNTFLSISSSIDVDLFGASSISTLLVISNKITGLQISGYLLSMSSSYLENLLIDSNTLVDIGTMGGYLINSQECGFVLINNNTVQNSNPQNTFMSISCDMIDIGVTLQNSNFENITQTSRLNVLQALNVISIATKFQSEDGNTKILLENNAFKNITVTLGEGFTIGVIENSFIFIMAVNSNLTLANNSFDQISVAPQGNVFLISIPTINLINSIFTNFQFYDLDGAFKMLFYNLSISNCTFASSIGYGSGGAGLMKFTNPSPNTNSLNVLINNCTFEGNAGSAGTIINAKQTPIQMTLDNVNLTNNYVNGTGGLFYFESLYSSNILINDCIFQSDDGYVGEYSNLQVFIMQASGLDVNMNITDSIMTIGDGIGGSFIQIANQQTVSLNISNYTFTNSSTSIGMPTEFSIIVADNLNATLQMVNVSNITVDQVGLFILNCNMAQNLTHVWSLQILQSSFTGLNLSQGLIVVDSDEYLAIPLNNLTVLIQSSTFKDIVWTSSSGGVISSATSLIGKNQTSTFAITVYNCTFQNLTGVQGLIYNGVESNYDSVLWLNQSRFDSITATSGGALVNPTFSLLSDSSKGIVLPNGVSLQISNCDVSNINAQSGAVFRWESQARGVTVILEDNTMTNISVTEAGGVFFGTFQVSTINQTQISRNFVTVYLKNSSYLNVSAQNGAIFYSEITSQLLNITFDNSTFDLTTSSQNGGVIELLSLPIGGTTASSRILQSITQSTGNLTVTNSSFSNMSAEDGGFLYENTANNTLSIILQGNSFQNFYADSRGGVLYLTEPLLFIEDNQFSNCTAYLAGDIIFSLSSHLDMTNFSSNNISSSPGISGSAILYAFAPTNLKIEFISLDNSTNSLSLDNYQNFSTNPTAPNLTSYSLTDYIIKLTLINYNDQDGNVQVVADESQTVSLALIFFNEDSQKSQNYNTSNCNNSVCQATPTGVTLTGKAGDTFLVNATYISDMYTQFQQFEITLRACVAGEINDTTAETCVYCSFGTYSVNPSDKQCNNCPVGAVCEGGSSIIIQEAYYRSENTTDLYILPCNDSAARCLGGYNNTCSEVYMGPLCSQCNNNNGYLTSNSNGCAQCLKETWLIAEGVLLLVTGVGYQIFMIIVTYKENKKKILEESKTRKEKDDELQPGTFMVILTSFSQITSIISSFDVGSISSLFSVSVNIGNPNSQGVFSLQCLYYLTTYDPFKALQFDLLLYVFSPVIKIIVAIFFELIRGLIWRDKKGERRKNTLIRIGAVVVVLILMEQPAIIGILCDYLNCTQLDPYIDEYFITSHNNIQCYTPKYYEFRNYLVFPGLLFWGFVVPTGIFLILRANRGVLFTSQPLKIVFGNFYTGYNPEAYYWGILFMNFKMGVFILNSVLTASQIAKGLVFMCLFHGYHMVFRRSPPYNHESLNKAERYCSMAYMMILTMVFFRLTIVHAALQITCTVIIAAAVVAAGGYVIGNVIWLHLSNLLQMIKNYKATKEAKKVLKETMKKLSLYHRRNRGRIDQHRRRNALSLELPASLRQSGNHKEQVKDNISIPVEEAKQKRPPPAFYQRIKKAQVFPEFPDEENSPQIMSNREKNPAKVEPSSHLTIELMNKENSDRGLLGSGRIQGVTQNDSLQPLTQDQWPENPSPGKRNLFTQRRLNWS